MNPTPADLKQQALHASALHEQDPLTGLELARSALSASEERGWTEASAWALAAMARCLTSLDRCPEAEEAVNRALTLFRECGDRSGESTALNVLSNLIGRRGDPRGSEEAAHQALESAEAAGDAGQRARSLECLGLARYRQGDSVLALSYHQRSLAIYSGLGDLDGEARALNHIGSAYDRLGLYDRAVSAHRDALRLQQQNGNEIGMAGVLNNLGSVYSEIGDLETALECHQQCLAVATRVGRERLVATALGNIGCDLARLGDFAASLDYSRRAVERSHAIGQLVPAAGFRLNVGSALLDLGRVDEALDEMGQAQSELEAMGQLRGQAEAHLALGRAYHRRSVADPTERRHFPSLGRALSLAGEIESRRIAASCHEELSASHERDGNLAEALRHFREFHRLQKEMLNEETLLKAKTIQSLHFVEQARHEAEQQRVRSSELASALDEARSRQVTAERLALEDPLTGLANRRNFDQLFDLAFQRAREENQPLAVAFCDIDHFKRINDRLGHTVGDEVLRRVGVLLRKVCRGSDLVARYGGEEFVLSLTGVEPEALAALGERIRRSVEEHPWDEIHPDLRVTVSIGLCPQTADASPAGMLTGADRRLYEAKRSGRNRVR